MNSCHQFGKLERIHLRGSRYYWLPPPPSPTRRRAPPERRSRGQVLQVPGMKQLRHIQAQFAAGLQEEAHVVLGKKKKTRHQKAKFTRREVTHGGF